MITADTALAKILNETSIHLVSSQFLKLKKANVIKLNRGTCRNIVSASKKSNQFSYRDFGSCAMKILDEINRPMASRIRINLTERRKNYNCCQKLYSCFQRSAGIVPAPLVWGFFSLHEERGGGREDTITKH